MDMHLKQKLHLTSSVTDFLWPPSLHTPTLNGHLSLTRMPVMLALGLLSQQDDEERERESSRMEAIYSASLKEDTVLLAENF